ncbi:hypothetical protein KUCAC02_025709, partial [Chaenocephalus aceratus]
IAEASWATAVAWPVYIWNTSEALRRLAHCGRRKTLIYRQADQPACPPPKANTHGKHHRLCVVAA